MLKGKLKFMLQLISYTIHIVTELWKIVLNCIFRIVRILKAVWLIDATLEPRKFHYMSIPVLKLELYSYITSLTTYRGNVAGF